MITFTVPAVPVAQPRQRHRLMQSQGRTFTTNFTPAKHPVQAFKASVQLAASEAYHGPPLSGPIALRLLFLMPRPGRLRWAKKPMPRCAHVSKPDADNLAKACKDALSKLIWNDDSQVCDVRIQKLYANGSEQPHVVVEIDEFSDEVLAAGLFEVPSEYA